MVWFLTVMMSVAGSLTSLSEELPNTLPVDSEMVGQCSSGSDLSELLMSTGVLELYSGRGNVANANQKTVFGELSQLGIDPNAPVTFVLGPRLRVRWATGRQVDSQAFEAGLAAVGLIRQSQLENRMLSPGEKDGWVTTAGEPVTIDLDASDGQVVYRAGDWAETAPIAESVAFWDRHAEAGLGCAIAIVGGSERMFLQVERGTGRARLVAPVGMMRSSSGPFEDLIKAGEAASREPVARSSWMPTMSIRLNVAGDRLRDLVFPAEIGIELVPGMELGVSKGIPEQGDHFVAVLPVKGKGAKALKRLNAALRAAGRTPVDEGDAYRIDAAQFWLKKRLDDSSEKTLFYAATRDAIVVATSMETLNSMRKGTGAIWFGDASESSQPGLLMRIANPGQATPLLMRMVIDGENLTMRMASGGLMGLIALGLDSKIRGTIEADRATPPSSDRPEASPQTEPAEEDSL